MEATTIIYLLVFLCFVDTAAVIWLATRPRFSLTIKARGMNSKAIDLSQDHHSEDHNRGWDRPELHSGPMAPLRIGNEWYQLTTAPPLIGPRDAATALLAAAKPVTIRATADGGLLVEPKLPVVEDPGGYYHHPT